MTSKIPKRRVFYIDVGNTPIDHVTDYLSSVVEGIQMATITIPPPNAERLEEIKKWTVMPSTDVDC